MEFGRELARGMAGDQDPAIGRLLGHASKDLYGPMKLVFHLASGIHDDGDLLT